MGKAHEKVFPGAQFQIISETILKMNSHFATFFMDFTQCF